MKTIPSYLIVKLYTWTVRDLEKIYDRCFTYSYDHSKDVGPSNSFALMLAALFDTWGSIFNDNFGNPNNQTASTKKNVEKILTLLYDKDASNYQIWDDSQNKIMDSIVKIFRHNLVHSFGKDPATKGHDLNIDTAGFTINKQENGRWHINCKKLKEDFLNLLRIKLPDLLTDKENFKRY